MTKRKVISKPDKLRKPGEHWYELVEHFDVKQIQRIPVKDGRAFLMGRLDELHIVEVPKETTSKTIRELGGYLSENGIEAMIVIEGIRFLKLATTTADVEKVLDGHELQKEADESPKETDPELQAPGA